MVTWCLGFVQLYNTVFNFLLVSGVVAPQC